MLTNDGQAQDTDRAADDGTADRAAALMHRAYQKNAIERMTTSMNLLDDVDLTQSPEPKVLQLYNAAGLRWCGDSLLRSRCQS